MLNGASLLCAEYLVISRALAENGNYGPVNLQKFLPHGGHKHSNEQITKFKVIPGICRILNNLCVKCYLQCLPIQLSFILKPNIILIQGHF